jgi:hypothetical protein
MSPVESAALAKYIRAHFPQQPIDEYTAEALSELLADYSPADCRAAVLAIAKRGEKWCSPSEVAGEVKRIRGKRIELAGDLCPPPGLTDGQEREWLLWARRRVGDGQPLEVDYGELKGGSQVNFRELLAAPDDDDLEESA